MRSESSISLQLIHLELYTPDQWEIDKDSVTLDRLIGQGHFGQVYQGVLKLSDSTLKSCAVKVKEKNVLKTNSLLCF